jgi:hypothetical protein
MLNMKGLDDLLKAIKSPPIVRVGILGGKNQRSEKQHAHGPQKTLSMGSQYALPTIGPSNAEIGLKHEYGSAKEGLPIRSFLKEPITDNLQKYLDVAGAFSPGAVKRIIQARSLSLFMKKVGIIAETIVQDAFQTGGFGKWKPSNMKYKKVQQTLVETQQLRNSITSDVKETA